MMNYIKKHKKAALFIGGMVIFLVAFLGWQRNLTLSNTLSGKLKDSPRKGAAAESTFYSDQLTKKEQEVYLFLKENMEQKMGGVLTLPQTVNGKEYQRILSTLEYEGDNYFYGFVEIPMTEDEIYVQHEDKNLNRITENEISKVILFLSCAEGIETPGVFSEDGTVTNMEEIRESLSVNVSEKEEKIQEKQKQTEEILSEILEGLPKDSGEKSTVDYFLKWLDGNMTYTDSLSEVGEPVPNMGKMLDAYYERNHLAAVIEKKATALGYAKILAELCNRAGMEAHAVAGTWKGGWVQEDSYVFCAVSMNGQTIYVDAAGVKAGSLGGERYLTEQEAFAHIKAADYFSYE